MTAIRVCDYCGEKWPKYQIAMSRTPNDERVYAELCSQCLADIEKYIKNVYKLPSPGKNTTPLTERDTCIGESRGVVDHG